jgi:mRNA interferase RelE/StbE
MKLVITEKAEKDLSRLDKKICRRIRDTLEKLFINPGSVDLIKMHGFSDRWRLRVGNYRVLLKITGKEVTVYALRVKHRREAY